MRRILLIVAYDGTGYHGWQSQPAQLTVQGKLQEVLSDVLGEKIVIDGASRTDAGVHARGQAASFTTVTPVPTDRLAIVANMELPPDIRIVSARDVEDGFKPRFDAIGKHYRYSFYSGKIDDVFLSRYVAKVRGCLDVDAMSAAATWLEGEHDFACFQNSTVEKSATTVRRLFHVGLERPGDSRLQIDVVGNAFLYNMVRVLAGTLLEVGQGRREVLSVKAALESSRRSDAGITAPPSGLCLEEVFFLESRLDETVAELKGSPARQ